MQNGEVKPLVGKKYSLNDCSEYENDVHLIYLEKPLETLIVNSENLKAIVATEDIFK